MIENGIWSVRRRRSSVPCSSRAGLLNIPISPPP
jgi:hypothetical protein